MSIPSREIWGPIVWKLLHTMADLSDRRDIFLLWPQVLNTTAEVLPCDRCSRHMKEYIYHNPLVRKNWPSLTPKEIREAIRTWLFRFHNSVSERLKKSTLESLPLLPTDRAITEQIMGETLTELLGLWESVKNPIIGPWKGSVHHLMMLLKCGSEQTKT